jgi:flavin reductase (DIM6/NTAB) family NADH-FMN oxidoreductase RutF
MKKSVSVNSTLFSMPVSCISVGTWDNSNIITLAYVGKVCLNPPIIAIGVHPARYSHKFLEQIPEFVINVPSSDQTNILDGIGIHSGRDINKWEHFGLTKEKGEVVETPMIKEFPYNMECKIVGSQSLGSHTVFFGKVVANHIDEDFFKNQEIDGEMIDQPMYIHGNYYKTQKKSLIGVHGFSIKI